MRTVVIPPPGVHGFGRSRTVGVVQRPLSLADAQVLVDVLSDVGIDVAARPGPTVHLTPLAELTTAQEVTVLTAFQRVTDARLAWHPAVAS